MNKYEPHLPKSIDYQAIAEAIVRMAPTYRAPYVSIIGFSEALLEGLSGQLNDTQSSDVEAIRVSGWQALGHLNDVLDVMLLISGEMVYDKFPTDLNDLLRDVARDVERTRLETTRPLELTVESKPAHIEGDELRLRQAFLGLIGNAMVNVPSVPVRLRSVVQEDSVLVTIRDGCEVANVDDLTYFFEPGWMSKLENNRWRQMQWQSYLAHHFVTAHGGKIWVEKVAAQDDEIPAGTQVSITLPLTQQKKS